MKDINGEEFFSFLEEYEENEKLEWLTLDKEKKEDCFKYLKLMKRFNKNNKLISPAHKKWMLENCDLPTHLIPNEVVHENNLWL